MKNGKLLAAGGVLVGIVGVLGYKKFSKRNSKENDNNGRVKVEDRLRAYYDITNRWILLKNEEKNLSEYFEENGYKKIAIYGMGNLGLRLYEELKKTNTKVEYGVDHVHAEKMDDLNVYCLKQLNSIDDVDAIVVTPVFSFDEIKEDLEKVTDKPIISLNTVVFGL